MLRDHGSKTPADLFADSVNLATARQLAVVELFGRAAALSSLNENRLVVELYKTWIAHNAEDGLLHAVYFNYGVTLAAVGDHAGAINAYREGIRLKPDFYPSYINLGRLLEDSGQVGMAVAKWLELVNGLPSINGETVTHKVTALQQIGRVLENAYKDAAAEDALKQSLDINPHHSKAIIHWISLRQRQCKWPVIEPWERVSRRDLLGGISSLSLACLADDPMFQLATAYHYAKTTIGIQSPFQTQRAEPAKSLDKSHKLRIGYVSSDLRDHAVGFAMTDVTETHDREKFKIFAYYCGINRSDRAQQRIMKAVDCWVDINGLSDEQAASRIAADEIDILVDLNGYTKDARTGVFARRPAPIAVNWFGFPGSMGTPYHHYIIADPYIIPHDHEIYFSEKVMRLPCYQPIDRKREVSERRPSRADAGLPEDAVVYCCLNGMQKITPRTFERWMTILRRVPRSVLWVLTGTDDANERLRAAGIAHGIAPERIIFAEKKVNPDHLARYPLADLFLDTLPYGAHTTAADALWMNVPVLTLQGRSFASRVCASFVRTAGLEELVCTTADRYVERAVELGCDRRKLDAVKAKLIAGRGSCFFFDTPRFVRHLEDLYRQMWSDLIRGALPVPDLRNLDVYHEIGVDLDLENIEAVSDEAYSALYEAKLAEHHRAYPISPDMRLWRETKSEPIPLINRRAVA
jgi:predicted O-linked N-acetylglucosamine transferase (SPINDLY family)